MSEPIPKSLYVSDNVEEFWREPLDSAKFPPIHGTVNIIKDRCKSCEFCIEFCPQGILELSDEFNSKGYHPPVVTMNDGCISCHLCELICPEFAIYVTDNDEHSENMKEVKNGNKK